jgi:hypothetical protein
MNINESINLKADILVKDSSGNDIAVANLSVNSLDASTMNLAININTYNKALMVAEGAANKAGETVTQQYTEFYNTVVARAQSLGYVIFGAAQ